MGKKREKVIWGAFILAASVLSLVMAYAISSASLIVLESQGFPDARIKLEQALPQLPSPPPEASPSPEPKAKEHRCIRLVVGLDTKVAKDCFGDNYAGCAYWFAKKARESGGYMPYATTYYQIAIGCASKYDSEIAKNLDKYRVVYETCVQDDLCWDRARGKRTDFIGRPELDELLENLFGKL